MKRIAIAGGPGSGKSSLARQLVTELYNKQNRNAQLVTEFARDHINACRRASGGEFEPTLADQLLIYHSQIEREDIIPGTAEFIITDSPAFLSLVFASNLCNWWNYQDRSILFHLYGTFFRRIYRYDRILFVQREKPFLSDGTRGETEEEACQLDNQMLGFLDLYRIPYVRIRGTDEERLEQALSAMEDA